MSGSLVLWIGRVLTGAFALFMVGASIAPKLAGAQVARDAMVKLGWDERFIPLIGLIELSCLVLHLYPRTSILGSVLMTGLLGGSIAAQLRATSRCFRMCSSGSISAWRCGADYGSAIRISAPSFRFARSKTRCRRVRLTPRTPTCLFRLI